MKARRKAALALTRKQCRAGALQARQRAKARALAIRTEALRAGKSASAIIEEILKREFAKHLEEARKTIKQRGKKAEPT